MKATFASLISGILIFTLTTGCGATQTLQTPAASEPGSQRTNASQPVTNVQGAQKRSQPIGSSHSQSATMSATAAAKPLTLGAVHMINAQVGWGTEANGHAVIRTTDGGRQWVDVTPPSANVQHGILNAYFLDSDHAWVTVLIADQSVTVYHTSDAGKTWTASAPFKTQYGDGGLRMDFVDAKHGFIEVSAAGNATQPGQLFATSDGGGHWTQVGASRWNTTNQQHNLPFAGDIVFENATDGWLTGGERAAQPGGMGGPGFVWLYKTKDGGNTWTHVDVPVPAALKSDITSVGNPACFGATVLIPTTFQGPGTSEITKLYQSQDSGKWWTLVSMPYQPTKNPQFINRSQGFSLLHGLMYKTSDGGRHWSAVATHTDLKNIFQLDFLTPTVGFAVLGYSDHGLLKTTDGGHTWTRVPAALVPTASQDSLHTTALLPDGFRTYKDVFQSLGPFLANLSDVPVMLPSPQKGAGSNPASWVDVQYQLDKGYHVYLSYGPKLPANSSKIVDGYAENLMDVQAMPVGSKIALPSPLQVKMPDAKAERVNLGHGITGTMYSGTDAALHEGTGVFRSVIWKQHGWTFKMFPANAAPAAFLPALKTEVSRIAKLTLPGEHGQAVLNVAFSHPCSEAVFQIGSTQYAVDTDMGDKAITFAAQMTRVD